MLKPQNKPAKLDTPALPTPLACAGQALTTPSLPQAKPRICNKSVPHWGRGVLLLAALLTASAAVPAQIAPMQPSAPPPKPQKNKKPSGGDIEWLWQYTPDSVNKDGRENELVQDQRFRPMLEDYLTTPQSFWGTPVDGFPRTLAITALDHLTVPDRVIADENRYVSIEGCVVHFCPARGLLWVDLGGPKDRSNNHLMVFAAIDWNKQGRPTTDPAADYTLWVFSNEPLPNAHAPAALTKAISRWAAEPLPGSEIIQNITRAVVIDPDGTPHQIAPAELGVHPPPSPNSDDESAPALKPRN